MKYNNVFCIYREILKKVWDERNNPKVNPIIDDIGNFALLEFMYDFEYNMIYDLNVPTEQELEKHIDVTNFKVDINNILKQGGKDLGKPGYEMKAIIDSAPMKDP
jgi:hypothetical protein